MYMYKMLKEALAVPKMESGKVSPNNVKALVITRGYILVVYHVNMPKLVRLDIYKSAEDFDGNGKGGALHNLLNARQLSCLEEIYVDSALANYKGLMDLEGYITKLNNTASRLRYYGYVNDESVETIANNYQSALSKAMIDYTIAEDKGRKYPLQVISNDNSNWFTKHNLRPENYTQDAEKAVLSVWLRKVEAEVKKQQVLEIQALRSKGIASAVDCLVKQDVANLEIYSLYMMLFNAIMYSKDSTHIQVFKAMSSAVAAQKAKYVNKATMIERPSSKISSEDLKKYANSYISSLGTKGKFLLSSYSSLGIIQKADLELEKLVAQAEINEGFMRTPHLVYFTCKLLAKRIAEEETKNRTSSLKILTLTSLDALCKVVLSRPIEEIMEDIKNEGNATEIYIKTLLGICGFNPETLKKYIANKQEKVGDK